MKKNLMMILSCLLCIYANAQCLTDQVNNEILKNEPGLMQLHNQFYNSVTPVSNAKRTAKYIIPVVFHVIHTNGPENISLAQIQDQIRILNEDYSYTNPNKSNIRNIFKPVAADMQIEFRLATLDPSGNCFDGVNRVYSSEHINAYNSVKSVPSARWKNNMYLNIWVVSSINSNGAPGIVLGYAQFPSSSVGTTYNSTDGIVVRADYVGSIGTSNANRAGRVLTHEIGHYLGLLHPFTDSCAGAGKDAGDRCEDTPPVAGTFTNANCNPNTNSCHTDTLPDLPDQFENYMDYSEGKCQAMFTQEQMAIVHHTFEYYDFRANMVSEANLIATGVLNTSNLPLAGFNSSSKTICAGKTVTFYDVSCKGASTSRTWTFEGGNITTSTAQNPTVKYNTPGHYSVTLTTVNANGQDTVTGEQYIEVLPGVAMPKGYLEEGFEWSDFEARDGWKVIVDPGSDEKLVVTSGSGSSYGGNGSLKAPISTFTRVGTLFRLQSPYIDLRPLIGLSPKLSFMCAYAKPNINSVEVLRVLSSNDCGNTWVTRYTKQTSGLYSTPYAAQDYVPVSQSEWKQHSLPLNFAQNDSNALFIIEIQSDAGGPVYIDNINISQFNTQVDHISIDRDLLVFPVPAKDEVNITLTSTAEEQATVEITNSLGQIVYTEATPIVYGEQTIKVSNMNSLMNGVYFINIKTSHQQFLSKLIINN